MKKIIIIIFFGIMSLCFDIFTKNVEAKEVQYCLFENRSTSIISKVKYKRLSSCKFVKKSENPKFYKELVSNLGQQIQGGYLIDTKKLKRIIKNNSNISLVKKEQVNNISNSKTENSNKIEINAKSVILKDFNSGKILFEKDADRQIFPASMTKIMTSIIAFEQLNSGKINLGDKFLVSEKAWRLSQAGYSSMFIMVGDRISVENLLRGIIVSSGNDACVALAEGIAGTEKNFVQLMNKKAQEIGMENTNFSNSTGISSPDNISTVRDIAKMSEYLIRNYPFYYNFFKEKEFKWDRTGGDPIIQGNRNPLLYKNIGVDGIKTGYLNVEKYQLAASIISKDKKNRLIAVGSGYESKGARSRETSKLLLWGMNHFKNFEIAKKDPKVDEEKRKIEEEKKKIEEEKRKIEEEKRKIAEQKKKKDELLPAGSGSGFFVSDNGHIITNFHVIDGCGSVKVSFKGELINTKILAVDKYNDLAIINSDIFPEKVFSIAEDDASLLEDIIVAGYPLGKQVSATIKTSKGSVTSLAGYGDNFSEFQLDAALNSGNSGGPIINNKGNIVGVAVAAFGKEKGVESFNFGIKSSTLKVFANSNGLEFLPENKKILSNKDLGNLITKATVYLECYMTLAEIKKLLSDKDNKKAFYSEYE